MAAMLMSMWIIIGVAVAEDQICGRLDNVYNPDKEICCGGQSYSRFQNSKEMACCERTGRADVYPKHEKLCCGEQLVSVQRGQFLTCCNKELINEKNETCCGNQDFGVKFSLDSTDICCSDDKRQEIEFHKPKDGAHICCGTFLFNKDTHDCLLENGTFVVRKMSQMSRCGAGMFDTNDELCCGKTGKVIQKPKQRHHIGSVINPPKWVCWNDKAFDSNKHDYDSKTSTVIPKGSKLCGNVIYIPGNNDLKCCGENLLSVTRENYKNYTCCGDQLLDLGEDSEDCCNNKIIQSSKQGCCNGSPFDKGHDLKCCVNTLINKSVDICCTEQTSFSQVVKKQDLSHTDCCISTATGIVQTYNKYEKVCDDGEIKDKESKTDEVEETCQFCSQTINQTTCNKSNVFRFFAYDRRLKEHSTILDGVILQPFRLPNGAMITGEKVKIRTQSPCECFKKEQNFYLFTNRKLKHFKDKYNVRFTSRDVFIAEDDTDTYKACLEFRKLVRG